MQNFTALTSLLHMNFSDLLFVCVAYWFERRRSGHETWFWIKWYSVCLRRDFLVISACGDVAGCVNVCKWLKNITSDKTNVKYETELMELLTKSSIVVLSRSCKWPPCLTDLTQTGNGARFRELSCSNWILFLILHLF